MEKRSSAGSPGPVRDRVDAVLAQGAYALIRRTLRSERYGVAMRLVRWAAQVSPRDVSGRVLERVDRAYADAGDLAHSAPAQRDLLRIARIFPHRKILFARLLRIGVYTDIDAEIAPFIGRHAAASVLCDPEIRLLLLFQRIKTERFAGTVQDWLDIPFDAVRDDPLLVDVWRISTIHLILKNEADYFQKFNPAAFVKFIEIESDPNIAIEILMKLLYKPIQPHLVEEAVALLAATTCDGAPERFAVVYFFLTTCGHGALGARFESLNAGVTEGRLHPLYIRAKLGPLGLQDEARDLSPDALERTSRHPGPWHWRTAELLKAEIGERLKNTARSGVAAAPGAAADRTHVLVAFFGQMRFPARTLPGIKRWIDGNFAGRADHLAVSYGVSTWRATGSKIVTPENSFDYLLPYFPPGFEAVVRKMALSTVSDSRTVFPRFAEALLPKLSATSEVVVEDEVERLLGAKVHFDISEDAQFMRDTGSSIAAFAPNDRLLLNQGRMIDRIGAVAHIIDRIEREDRPVTHVLFIRPDLHQLAGSIAACLDRCSAKRNWCVLDQDRLAQLIEGVGDRYMLADRAAAAHITGMRDKVRRVFGAVPRDDRACTRLSPHQMLASVLFENAVEVRTVPQSEIPWDFLRTTFTWRDFLEDLRLDVGQMADGPVKREMLAAMPA